MEMITISQTTQLNNLLFADALLLLRVRSLFYKSQFQALTDLSPLEYKSSLQK